MQKTDKKTFLLNEAINNHTTMGTSVNEQILCSSVYFH